MLRPAVFAFALIAAAPCVAQTDGQAIHRCIGAHGEISFSGLPCGGATTPGSPISAAMSPSEAASIATSCPASTDALRGQIAAAFSRRDANALASMMRWGGVGGAAARERMRELSELTKLPLLGIELDDDATRTPTNDVATSDSRDAPSARERVAQPVATQDDTTGTGALRIRTGSSELGAREHEFHVVPAGGCYWLDW